MYTVCFLVVLCVYFMGVLPIPSAAMFNWTCKVYSKPGNISIGAIFQFKDSANGVCQGDVGKYSMMFSEATIWAVEEINARNDILPNITIGYEIRDGCSSEDVSLWSAMSFFTDTCSKDDPQREAANIVALISAAPSVTTVWMSKVANLFHLPLLSSTATSDELSDIVRFPYFFRTVPSDRFQVNVIIDILLKFDWKYIALMYSTDTYGLHGARQVKTEAEKAGICIAMTATIQPYAPKDEVDDAVLRLFQIPKANVVVVFALGTVARSILTTVKDKRLSSNLTWIGSDGSGLGYESTELAEILAGSFFVRPNVFFIPTPKFAKDFASRDPDSTPGTPWYNEFWLTWKESKECSNITQCPFFTVWGASAINCVYALSYALHAMYIDSCDEGNCLSPERFSGPRLKEYLLNVSFNTTDGIFKFDQNGDTSGKYQISNIQKQDEEYVTVTIGYWDARFSGEALQLEEENIQFVDQSNRVPFSLCREQCKSGHITIPLEEKCCYGCQACPINAIVVDNICEECPLTHWPDESKSICESIQTTFVKLKDPVVLTILVLSSCGIIVSLVTAAGLWIYRNHPLIKATSRELSAVNLLGVTIAFIDALLLLIEPTSVSCPVIESMISLCFTVMFAPTLLKIVRIYRIFRAGKRSVRRPRFVSVPDQVVMVSVLITIQVGKYFFPRFSYTRYLFKSVITVLELTTYRLIS